MPLEKLFDNNDVSHQPKIKPNVEEVEDCNIRTEEDSKIIKISNNLSPEAKSEYIRMLTKFSDVFAWIYDDLKVYDTNIIQHTILVKEEEKPFTENLRRINPLLLPLIEKERNKLFDAKIIISLRFSKWVANLVPVRKKNGEIRLCVDFINLKRVSWKDNYPLPKIDHIS